MSKDNFKVKEGEDVDLNEFSTDTTGPFKSKDDAVEPTAKNLRRLNELQGVLYAEAKHALLIVFQAMDAGGKDGSIEHVFSGINPQGCQVTAFKVPSDEDRAHDYLWRYHMATPHRGMIGIFNRSHYESVLVERVKGIVTKDVWKKRYEQINDFEEMLSAEGTVILKFFLHISKDEQKKRLEERLKDPTKNWKFNPGDLDDRKLWDDYQAAYTDAIAKCSTKESPWYIVPSDRKWFRNWMISDTIVKRLQDLDMKYPKPAKGIENLKVE